MTPTPIQTLYPWTADIFIAGAPMGPLISTPSLAAAITNAGGLGFIGGGYASAAGSQAIDAAAAQLAPAITQASNGMLPLGIGFLLFAQQLDAVAAIVQKYKPIALWLFAPHAPGDYALWTWKLRKVSPNSHIWLQVGSATEAVELANHCKPDVIVCQGADAGGHGSERGAGVISLVPEIADALAAAGHGHIPLVAAGGIVEGRGVAASVALGAAGVAMGTRFLAADEVELPAKGYRQAILDAADGGQVTVRGKLFDDLGPRGIIWPVEYDGRAIRNISWLEKKSGVSTEELRKRGEDAVAGGDDASGGKRSRVTIWAGTGVGLVKECLPAATIVENVRTQALQILNGLGSRDGK